MTHIENIKCIRQYTQHIVHKRARHPKHTREGVQKRRKGQKKGEKGLTTGKIGDRITTLFPRGDREKSLNLSRKNLKKVKENP